jgi:hypothetical protein
MAQESDNAIGKIYSTGQNAPNTKERQTSNKQIFNLSILGKRKGCVITVSILASVFILSIPIIWVINSPTSEYEPNFSSAPIPNTSPSLTITQENDQEKLRAIDLGLPSGTLWANMNIGADTIYAFGDLFSWGDTKIKDSYTQYDYVKETTHQTLEGKYDAAYTIFGSEWQTPSASNFQELIDNCQWTWTSHNGHNGYEVKGSNGNIIFLPASGWIHTNSVEYQNKFGYYWTSDRVNDTFAKGLLFSKSEKKLGNGYLWYGRNIRPIKKRQR